MNRIVLSVWNAAFWIVLFCQATVLPATLGFGVLSRIANTLVLALFAAGALLVLAARHAERVAVFYLLPVLLVAVGYIVNVARSADIEALSHLGLVVPWLAMLSVPFVEGFDWRRYWGYFHVFMLVTTLIALAEFGAVAAGMFTPTLIETSGGTFSKGIITIFHSLEDGDFYPRLYSVFPEPGTCAMFLIPAISYAVVMRKFVALLVYVPALALTSSLGGYFASLLLGGLVVLWLMRGKHVVAGLAIVGASLVFLAVFGGALYEYGNVAYTGRGASATVRESNVQLFLQNFMPVLATSPLGFDLHGQAYSQLEGRAYYFGSNFSLASATVTGGVLAFLGYLTFVTTNLVAWVAAFLRRRAEGVEAAALLCVPPLVTFVFQRATIFESALYAYLFAPLLLTVLRGHWMSVQEGFMNQLHALGAKRR